MPGTDLSPQNAGAPGCSTRLQGGAGRLARRIDRRRSSAAALVIAALTGATVALAQAAGAQPVASLPAPVHNVAESAEVGSQFATIAAGVSQWESANGVAATASLSWRTRFLLTTITPLDLRIVPPEQGRFREVALSDHGVECREGSTGSPVAKSRCELRIVYAASAETGFLLKSESPIWIGAGHRMGSTAGSYGALAIFFRLRDNSHLQLNVRAGRRYVQGTLGAASAF